MSLFPFPPGFPPCFPKTNYLWYPSSSAGSVFSRRSNEKSRLLSPDWVDAEYLVLFLPGNPGLVGYYSKFLESLASSLGDSSRKGVGDGETGFGSTRRMEARKPVSVLGISHAGFYVSGGDCDGDGGVAGGAEHEAVAASPRYTAWTKLSKPYTLHQQVEMKVELLAWIGEWFKKTRSTNKHRRVGKLKVLLVAHSVGCWVSMQLLSLIQNKEGQAGLVGEGDWHGLSSIQVMGGALVFPTLVDIAASRNGRVATVCINYFYMCISACYFMHLFIYSSVLKRFTNIKC